MFVIKCIKHTNFILNRQKAHWYNVYLCSEKFLLYGKEA